LEPALELTSVFQHVGERCALADVSLRVESGEWLQLVGPNGAGKSLLSRLILGLDTPSAGTIRLLGEDLGALNDPSMRRLRRKLGAVLQGGSLLGGMSVLENLLLPLRSAPLTRSEMARAARLVMTQLQLDGLENHLPRSLSLGQRRRVELARSLIHKPSLLVCDGLTDGLDPPGAREVASVLREQQEGRGLTLISTANRPAPAEGHRNRIAVLSQGRILFDGTPPGLEKAAAERLELRYLLGGIA
jgi:ABC-type multidrug transport system ATPase subunit